MNALRQVATRNTSMERINELDRQWLRELLLEEKPLIRRLQQTPPSRLMTNIARQHHLLLNKIFRTQRPLRPISRHQRWSPAIIGKLTKMTFDKPCAWQIHISDIEYDGSTQSFQSKVSAPIHDPRDGQFLGVLSLGINIETAFGANLR
ncbi:PDC sensor domain-containing protein [Ectopseudomonas oleovorans]|uniref:PDC sensor domain-containing protein n=2 Tax=Ectopseudomonas oleovorans TaxID=301 RepID=A0AA42U0R0_ECTOL|nr:PDC sensor domain-containing protein [Pseudomonas oleovorans]MDH1341250.1 PDC sensor domain-containing protein [Pseudomonas oleovorans]MDH1492152.1 PDC sensor domain-containing protein [Pseudomonas oleovorans]WGG23055.1 PDC sensor domain-containing protein [Pseudomonas oleovorans]